MPICKECGAKVEVKDGEIIRSCEHKNVAILADITANCQGQSGWGSQGSKT